MSVTSNMAYNLEFVWFLSVPLAPCVLNRTANERLVPLRQYCSTFQFVRPYSSDIQSQMPLHGPNKQLEIRIISNDQEICIKTPFLNIYCKTE